MSISAGIIAMWPGTAASIPAGWTRVAAMNSSHPKGSAAAVDPGSAGGAATHAHTASSHSHSTAGTHTHGVASTGGPSLANFFANGGTGEWSTGTHTHTSADTSGTGTDTFNSSTPTWQTASNDPAYYDVIFIESDGTPAGFPDTALLYSETVPSGWTQHSGSEARFFKGAAVGGNGGGTGGGAHTHTADAHTHGMATHTHTLGGSLAASANTIMENSSTSLPFGANSGHTHTNANYGAGGSGTSGSTASGISGSTSFEPTFYTLLAIENTSGSASTPSNHIALWTGLLADIPSPWLLCDGSNNTPDLRGKFVKIATVIGDVGVTDGTAGHSHTAPAGHTHTGVSHTHSVTSGESNNGSKGVGSGTAANMNHTHTITSDSVSTGDSDSQAQDAPSNANTEPSFFTVAYVYYPLTASTTGKNWFGRRGAKSRPTSRSGWRKTGALT